MGVTGLWSILQPCARPTKIETLNRKRLAVDASIWIYQFLKAVRDKEGNALRNSHVVGFFRRICKLLFFGIKPVFVFDGGAPALKRHVIRERKRRREGKRDDAVRTAGKLLAVQMQRRAEEEEAKRREARDNRADTEEAVPDEGLVYVDELFTAPQERQENRAKFRRKDAYHLPDLDVSMNEMGGPNDPRVMSLEELQAYARQFDRGEDINVYDFSKIDYDSAFFTSLPASDRYNILNAARLRSRLRMGHSKEQLDTMFPDRMAFSRFQIERVTERNELTQRLMHLNEGGDGSYDGSARVAGEKGREYVLVKNDGVEGGWALGVVSNEGRSVNEAIDLEKPTAIVKDENFSDDGEEFEDVAIEGLNRLPKQKSVGDGDAETAIGRQRKALYRSRRGRARRRPKKPVVDDPNSLFVADEPEDDAGSESESTDAELFEDGEEDEELRRAIALSLHKDEQSDEDEDAADEAQSDGDTHNDMLDTFHQTVASEAAPVPKGSGRSIANIVNRRAFNAAPESHEITSFGVPVPRPDDDNDNEDDGMDLTAALAESQRTRRKKTPPGPRFKNVQPHTPTRTSSQTPQKPKPKPEQSATDIAKAHGFSGPLPFEKLDLGSSLLGKKKMQERKAEAAGGFEDPALAQQPKKAEPLPPWFSGDLKKDLAKQREVEDEDRQKAKEFDERFRFDKANAPLRRHETADVIDLDAEEPVGFKNGEVVDLESDSGSPREAAEVKMDDIAEDIRASPPAVEMPDRRQPSPLPSSSSSPDKQTISASDTLPVEIVDNTQPSLPQQQDEPLDWSESEDERSKAFEKLQKRDVAPVGGVVRPASRSPSAEFEDIAIPDKPASPIVQVLQTLDKPQAETLPAHLVPQESMVEDDFIDDFSDPEDEDLLRSLAQEAEEHARFESTLNQRSVAQNIADYERELKQLRNQQKKDRRDADEVTHVMITECQQLLQLFGLPYITAPMEAEAQCAELVRLGLVDGIVTDDSDCFLFGGTRIYKNVFNQAKFVECYLASDLEKEFDLTREKMVAVAQLLGSDYTEGLSGVGPVTALEILAEFMDLRGFKDWWTGVQNLTITKQDDSGNVFRKKFRKNATKLFLPPAFPDERVSQAYMDPEVDASGEPFQWGVPDLGALRAYLMATIGWTQERTDEILVPVIKDMNRRMDEGTQSNITAFFEGGVGAGAAGRGQTGEAFAPRKRVDASKRMGKAMGLLASKAKENRTRSLAGDGDASEDTAGDDADTPSSSRKRKAEDDAQPKAKSNSRRSRKQ